MRWIAGALSGAVLLSGCAGMQTLPATTNGPTTFAAVAVVNQLALDEGLHGHNIAVSGCIAYVTMQNNLAPSKLATVNLCGAATEYGAAPVLVGEVAGTYPVMNGITADGSQLYVTYGWATNPFEVWNVGSMARATPTVVRCVPLFAVPAYATCGVAASGYGSLYGSNPHVIGNDVYVAENSDDPGQAVQVVDVSSPEAPVKVNAEPLGITAGKSSGGATLAGLWVAGSGSTVYLATVDDVTAANQPVTITGYDAEVNPVSPPQLGVPLNVPVGYAVQGMAVAGTTVVATLYDATTQMSEVMVGNFSNPAAPSEVMAAATTGCEFESQNFVAVQGSYAFVGCGTGAGIEAVQFSNVASPVVMGEIATSLNGVGFISPQGRYLYAVDQDGKLDTVDVGTVFE